MLISTFLFSFLLFNTSCVAKETHETPGHRNNDVMQGTVYIKSSYIQFYRL